MNGNTCYYQGGTTCLTSSSAALTPAKVNDNIVQFYSQQGRLRYRESGSSLIYSTRLNPTFYSLVTGLDFRRLGASDAELFYNTPQSCTAPQGRFDSRTDGRGVQTFHGLFCPAQVRADRGAGRDAVGAVDRYAIDERENRRTLANGSSTGGALPAASKTAFDPSIAARYEVSSALSLRGRRLQSVPRSRLQQPDPHLRHRQQHDHRQSRPGA
ncbi:hypothetical protein LP420_41150 [Massilia sp. B-10]|nr:hypothetical protein LP420_41150 [Massilia sp. B-10]